MKQYGVFKGLNTTSDPLRLGFAWQTVAKNLLVTSSGALEKRQGYVKVRNVGCRTGFATADQSQGYIQTTSNTIETVEGAVVAQLTTTDPLWWGEINGDVYYANHTDSGIILQNGTVVAWRIPTPPEPSVSVINPRAVDKSFRNEAYARVQMSYVQPDGRESGLSPAAQITAASFDGLVITPTIKQGCSTNIWVTPRNSVVTQHFMTVTTTSPVVWTGGHALGRDATTGGFDDLPSGIHTFDFFQGRVYAGQYLAANNTSVVWASAVFGFHLFDLHADFFMVHGRIEMLLATQDVLLVGTEDAIYAYDGKNLKQLAPYGVPSGQHGVVDTQIKVGRALFMSKRGLCEAMPFANLTDDRVSIPTNGRTTATLSQHDGQVHYLTTTLTGDTTGYNPLQQQPPF